jgi:hypothetical protein
VKKLVCTGLLVRKTIYLKQKIQKIYSEEIGMCSNDINVEKKTMFWLRKNGILEKNITGSLQLIERYL